MEPGIGWRGYVASLCLAGAGAWAGLEASSRPPSTRVPGPGASTEPAPVAIEIGLNEEVGLPDGALFGLHVEGHRLAAESDELLSDILASGAAAVVLEVHVLVEPRPPLDGRALPVELEAWRDAVTLEGDDVVRSFAARLRSKDRELVLWPHLVSGRTGAPVDRMPASGPHAFRALLSRVANATERAAEFANSLGADGLVVAEGEFLRRPGEQLTDRSRALMGFRRDIARATRRFSGDRVVLAPSPSVLAEALEIPAWAGDDGDGFLLGLGVQRARWSAEGTIGPERAQGAQTRYDRARSAARQRFALMMTDEEVVAQRLIELAERDRQTILVVIPAGR